MQRRKLGHLAAKKAPLLDYEGRKDTPVEEANAMQGEGAVRRVEQHLSQPSVSIREVPYVPIDVLQRLLHNRQDITTSMRIIKPVTRIMAP